MVVAAVVEDFVVFNIMNKFEEQEQHGAQGTLVSWQVWSGFESFYVISFTHICRYTCIPAESRHMCAVIRDVTWDVTHLRLKNLNNLCYTTFMLWDCQLPGQPRNGIRAWAWGHVQS